MGKVYYKPKLNISFFNQVEMFALSAEVDSDGLGFDFTKFWGEQQ